MAINGTHIDFYIDKFQGLIGHESQQKGSVLSKLVRTEMMHGNKNYFNILGKTEASGKSGRLEAKDFIDPKFEKRLVTPQFIGHDFIFDVEDEIRYIADPTSDYVTAAIYAMGRKEDEIIMNAIKNPAVVIQNDISGTGSLASPIAVTVGNGGSGDVGLNSTKLRAALTSIRESYAASAGQKLFCVAPFRQLQNLMKENALVSGDFRSSKPLEGSNVEANLSGFLGMEFIAFEDTGVDSSADELVYVLTEDAIKMGIFQPLKTEYLKIGTIKGNPISVSTFKQLGATRTREEAVVAIACDPLATIS